MILVDVLSTPRTAATCECGLMRSQSAHRDVTGIGAAQRVRTLGHIERIAPRRFYRAHPASSTSGGSAGPQARLANLLRPFASPGTRRPPTRFTCAQLQHE